MTESPEDIAQKIADDYGLLSGMREHIKQELRRDITDALRVYADQRLEEAATRLEAKPIGRGQPDIWGAKIVRSLKLNKETV